VHDQRGAEPAPALAGGAGCALDGSRSMSGVDARGIVAFAASRGRLVGRLRTRVGHHDRRADDQGNHAK
jgi:hypothetical protein